MEMHKSHNWRYSDSSIYDAVCTFCNCTDTSPQAYHPCGSIPENIRLVELAREAGLKGRIETQLSGQEQKFAELLIRECGQYTDPVTRNLMFRHFGIEGN